MNMADEPERPVIIPHDVTSAVTPEEAAALAALCRGKAVLELGAYHGYSTVVIASVAQHVTSVDWHQGDDMAGLGDTWDVFRNTVSRYGAAGRVTPVRERFETALPRMHAEGTRYDGCFCDAHHSAESVKADLGLAIPLIRPGGFVAFHDYGRSAETGNPGFGVTAVADEMVGIAGRTGYLAWGFLPG
jgi:predicted O-methyltransferase YrrM